MMTYLNKAGSFLKRKGILTPVVLLALVVLAFLVSSFLEVADDVLEGDTSAIDTALLMLLRDANDPQNPWGPAWLEDMMRDISALGGIAVLTLLTACSAAYLAITRKAGRALYLIAAVVTGTILSNVLKFHFDRPRPELVPHGSYTFTASFPSGHSMMAALVFLTLGALLAQSQTSRALRVYFMSVAVVLTLAVGFSRVYLGVHWPSDVLAGWLAGAIWALLFWTGQKILSFGQGQR